MARLVLPRGPRYPGLVVHGCVSPDLTGFDTRTSLDSKRYEGGFNRVLISKRTNDPRATRGLCACSSSPKFHLRPSIPCSGTWVLDLAKSSFREGPAPQSQLRIYEPYPIAGRTSCLHSRAEGHRDYGRQPRQGNDHHLHWSGTTVSSSHSAVERVPMPSLWSEPGH